MFIIIYEGFQSEAETQSQQSIRKFWSMTRKYLPECDRSKIEHISVIISGDTELSHNTVYHNIFDDFQEAVDFICPTGFHTVVIRDEETMPDFMSWYLAEDQTYNIRQLYWFPDNVTGVKSVHSIVALYRMYRRLIDIQELNLVMSITGGSDTCPSISIKEIIKIRDGISQQAKDLFHPFLVKGPSYEKKSPSQG